MWGDSEALGRILTPASRNGPEAAVKFTHLALETCRSLWARFNPALMVGGLGVIALSFLVE